MSEMPPRSGSEPAPSAEQLQPSAWPREVLTAEGREPPAKRRKELIPWVAALGFMMPPAGLVLALVVPGTSPSVLSPVLAYGPAVIALIAFVVGRVTGNDVLRSFGVGGLICTAVGLAITLLVLGTC